MKHIAICFLMSFAAVSTFAAAPTSLSFKGHVRGLNVSTGSNFANMTTATIEVTLDVGVTKKDNYSICQDISDREYSALLAVLIDSRSRNQESSFTAKSIPGATDFYCIISVTSP